MKRLLSIIVIITLLLTVGGCQADKGKDNQVETGKETTIKDDSSS